MNARVEAALPHKALRVLEVLLGLRGETHDKVGGEREAGDRRAQALHQVHIVGARVAPAHQRKDAVTPGLHREVHVLAHLRRCCDGLDETVREVLGMRGHEADPGDARDRGHTLQQGREVLGAAVRQAPCRRR